jgi:hypothetical protein
MATDVANLPAGSNADRDMLALALTDFGRPLEVVGDPDAALALLTRWSVPLRKEEPMGRPGPGTQRLKEGLRLIGAKIAPTMSEEQVQVWLTAMIVALSDLPARVSRKACQEAIHVPMRFLNEVEGVVRERAEEIETCFRLARSRLEALKRNLSRQDQEALPPPEPMSEEELQEIGPELRKIGLGAGWLKEGADGRLSWNEE